MPASQVVNGAGNWVSSGTGTLTVGMTQVPVPAIPPPGQTTAYAYVYDGNGDLTEGTGVTFRLVGSAGECGDV